MKTKSINPALIAIGLGIASSQFAGAALLFGYSSFTNDSSSESADLSPVFGFTSSVTKASASSDVNGSSDGLLGNSQYSAASGILDDTPGTGGNGYLNLSSSYAGTATSFSLTNNTGSTYQLEYLFFDGMRAVSGTGGTIRAQYNLGAGATLIGNESIPNPSATANASTDYVDFGKDISEIFLAAGETVSFLFTGNVSNLRLDNIAVTGSVYTPPSSVPEPGSFLALGCVLATGLGLRNRSRGPVKAA